MRSHLTFRRTISASTQIEIGAIIDPTAFEGNDLVNIVYVEDPRTIRDGAAPLVDRLAQNTAHTDHLPGIRAARDGDGNKICEGCFNFVTQTKSCATCGIARYCSKECQVAAWPAHKRRCKNSDRARQRREMQRAQRALRQQPATADGPSTNHGDFEEIAQINSLREIELFETHMAINAPRTDVDGTTRPPITNAEIEAQAALEEAFKEDIPHREGNWESSA